MFSFSNRHQEENLPTSPTGGGTLKTSGAPASKEAVLPQNEFMEKRAIEIEEQRKEFLKKKPDFDMKAELENEVFLEYLVKHGLSVEDAYFLAHREELIEEAAFEYVERIMERKNRIPENGAGKNSPVSVKPNPKDFSDKEIDEIIEKVRNGEKISF